MPKRLQVLVPTDEYAEIQDAANKCRMTVAEWVRQSLREARSLSRHRPDAKLRAIAAASQHAFPTADIDDMLAEIGAGRSDGADQASGASLADRVG
ncbi:antitoxin [Candidatus Poriferisodalis sp.]|uniref:antitoxin n=1 Tax=Candidatus Poriferisodalis sp. TaxID=3101277 RepID=UPI003B026407